MIPPSLSNSLHENLHEKISLEKIIEEIKMDEIQDIIEITYSYKNTGNNKKVNTTLFEKIGWRKKWENKYIAYQTTRIKLENKKEIFQKYIKQLKNKTLSARESIFLWTLEYVNDILQITLLGLPFEAEKRGIKNTIPESIQKSYIDSIDSIESKLFWWDVQSNKYETTQSLYKFQEEMKTIKEKEILNTEEYDRLSWYIQRIKSLPTFDENIEKHTTKKHNYDPLREKIKDTPIKREDYKRIFELFHQINKLKKWVIIDKTKSSIYDWHDNLYIPGNKSYETLPLERVGKLIQHEQSVHFMIDANNEKVLGKFRGAKNLGREEWLAKLLDMIFQNHSIQDLQWISPSIKLILMGEILNGEEYLDFLTIYYKGKGSKSNPKKIFDRRKRNYSKNLPGVQHKDTTYYRWSKRLAEELESGKDIRDYFTAKVSFEQIPLAKQIAEEENITLTYPRLLAELIKAKLIGKHLNKEVYIALLKKKYHFLKEDHLNSAKELTRDNTKKIAEILSIVKKYLNPMNASNEEERKKLEEYNELLKKQKRKS